MLQRLARSQASSKHLWKSLSSIIECTGVCQCSTSSAAAANEPIGQKLERRLKKRVNLVLANLAQPPEPVYAGVVIEIYPICFPDPAPWRLEHKEWQMQWNKWKFRQVTDEEMSADKQNVDESSAEVRVCPVETAHRCCRASPATWLCVQQWSTIPAELFYLTSKQQS